jgi:uncharacterized protein (TIGR02145 family)
MAENLRYKTDDGCWCYDNDESNSQKYGRLYNWEAAKRACPEGWHLPSRDEWSNLESIVDSSIGGTWRAERLKATSGWYENGNGTDNYGFSALPGGLYSGPFGRFSRVGNLGCWWITGNNTDEACFVSMGKVDDDTSGYDWAVGQCVVEDDGKRYGFSVRCVRKYGEKTAEEMKVEAEKEEESKRRKEEFDKKKEAFDKEFAPKKRFFTIVFTVLGVVLGGTVAYCRFGTEKWLSFVWNYAVTAGGLFLIMGYCVGSGGRFVSGCSAGCGGLIGGALIGGVLGVMLPKMPLIASILIGVAGGALVGLFTGWMIGGAVCSAMFRKKYEVEYKQK